MARVTDDPNDPGINAKGADGKNIAYLALSVEERSKGFVRPVRHAYVHEECGVVTKMSTAIAETYARNPKFYDATYCVGCRGHYPVSEFFWDGTEITVGD